MIKWDIQSPWICLCFFFNSFSISWIRLASFWKCIARCHVIWSSWVLLLMFWVTSRMFAFFFFYFLTSLSKISYSCMDLLLGSSMFLFWSVSCLCHCGSQYDLKPSMVLLLHSAAHCRVLLCCRLKLKEGVGSVIYCLFFVCCISYTSVESDTENFLWRRHKICRSPLHGSHFSQYK